MASRSSSSHRSGTPVARARTPVGATGRSSSAPVGAASTPAGAAAGATSRFGTHAAGSTSVAPSTPAPGQTYPATPAQRSRLEGVPTPSQRYVDSQLLLEQQRAEQDQAVLSMYFQGRNEQALSANQQLQEIIQFEDTLDAGRLGGH